MITTYCPANNEPIARVRQVSTSIFHANSLPGVIGSDQEQQEITKSKNNVSFSLPFNKLSPVPRGDLCALGKVNLKEDPERGGPLLLNHLGTPRMKV